MTLYMFDDVTANLIPVSAEYVAYYVDGAYANGTAIKARCPHAVMVGIAVTASGTADVLDIETGDAFPRDAAGWVQRRLAEHYSGPLRAPAVYTSAGGVDSLVNLLRASGLIHGRDYVIWSAHYTGTPHVCGPTSCRATTVTCDATQYTDWVNGQSLDKSEVAPSFLRAPAAPAPKPATVTVPDSDWPANVTLKMGWTGNAVKVLQQHLAASGQYGARGLHPIDGVFGIETLTAVRNYQTDEHLTADGVAGPATRARLGVK